MIKDQHGYPADARNISETAWFYEQREGLVVVVQPAKGTKATIVVIPWRKIEAAAKRRAAILAKRKRA